MAAPPTVLVSEWELRAMFNDGRFYERALAGEFVLKRDPLQKPNSPIEPPGTVAITEYYIDTTNQRIAVVHYYERPDKSIGGGGLPDPKFLRVGDVVYVCQLRKSSGAQRP